MNIDEMEKIEQEATKGPWIADHAVNIYTGKETMAVYSYPTKTHCVEIIEGPDKLNGECIHNEADWKFICAARDFVPWAIERIRHLEKENIKFHHLNATARMFILIAEREKPEALQYLREAVIEL